MEKKYIKELDLIRAFCAIGIICDHFAQASNLYPNAMIQYATGKYGDVFVTVFFILSGFVLQHNYTGEFNLLVFYKKRWKSIYPAFYIAFGFYYLKNVFAFKSFLYKGIPSVWLTVLGVDGYFLYLGDNYYILGEWFLGALIILYAIYPLLSFLQKKSDKILLCVAVVAYLFANYSGFFSINPFRNLFSCLLSFYIGMMMAKYYDNSDIEDRRNNIIIFVFSLIILLVLLTIKITDVRIHQYVLEHLTGTVLFVVLFYIGSMLDKFKAYAVIEELSRVSYPIFLLQHAVIYEVLAAWNPLGTIRYALVLLFTIMLIVIYAEALDAVSQRAILCGEKFLKKS